MTATFNNGKIDIFNPRDNQYIESIPTTSADECAKYLNRLSESQSSWGNLSIKKRITIINRFRKNIVQNIDGFINAIEQETGKRNVEAILEMFVGLEHVKQCSKIAKNTLKSQSRNAGILKFLLKKGHVYYEPYGLAVIISPSNYPLILTLSPMVEALLAGNSVILKPSEHTPLTAKLLKKIWDKSSDYPNIFEVVYGDATIANQIIESGQTHIVCFTGSTIVGKKIALKCAETLKPVILELGGKDPMIVLSDANIKRAVDAAIFGGFANAGQTCIGVKRIFVHQSQFEQFKTLIIRKTKTMKSGPHQNNELGPITIQSTYDTVINQLNQIEESDTIHQGTIDAKDGTYIPPTIIVEPNQSHDVHNCETFGPVINLYSFSDYDDLKVKLNPVKYALSGSIFGKNKTAINKVIKLIDAGSISINDVQTAFGMYNLPFGGNQLSGLGRMHGPEGLRAFTKTKSITTNRITLPSEFWWYGHKKGIEKLLRKFLKIFYSFIFLYT